MDCGVSFLGALPWVREADTRAAPPWISGGPESGAVRPSEPPARVSPQQADVPTGPGWHQPNRDNMPGFSESCIYSVFGSVLHSDLLSLLLS